ncbi:MAG: IscS subfamily cysteine desulfurase [archaeon]|nr:IscS subfamily cysteine desulfurase [archaeon]MCR4323524.1 IscS subfamily cysteine desulfurase [Nanoarchaeota archaeon]
MDKKSTYFDNAATTPVDKEVVKAMLPYFNQIYGNPGSMHSEGLKGKQALDSSRETISKILNCEPEEIIFTGSGTESINMAIKGIAHHQNKKLGKGNHIITQKTEHPAVLETCEFLEKEGYEVTYLDVDRYGLISLDELEKAIKSETILVSIMYANNEIGTIQPIKEISEICKKNKVLFHTDACQASEYLNLDVKNLGVDLMSLNASKVYGPKGIGLLFLRKGVTLTPLIHGGGQERRLRSGTENIPLIVGFAKALEIASKDKGLECERLTKLSNKLIDGILKTIPKAFLNGHPTKRLPNNVNISILDIEGEAALLYLDKEGICASTGSACTSKTLDPSHVILALGLPYEAAHGSMRFTLGKNTTKEGIEKLINLFPKIVKRLRDLSPVNLKAEDFKEYLSEDNKKISGVNK